MDTLAIFLVIPLIVFIKGHIAFDRRCRAILLAFGFLAIGVGLSLFLQLLFLGKSIVGPYLQNFQGYLRPVLFGVLAAIAIRSSIQAERIARLILFGVIVHAIIAILEFLNIQPFAGVINLLFRGDAEAKIGLRAIGAFDTVHSLAYFGIYSLVFGFAVVSQSKENPRLASLAKVAIGFSLIITILPFSRGAWISGIAASGYLLMHRGGMIKLLKSAIFLVPLAAATTAILPEVRDRVLEYYSSIVDGARFLLGASELADQKNINFITGRLEWGWLHALEVWRSHPLHGDMSISLGQFIGDGGYTEALANHGTIGFLSFFLMFIALWGGGQAQLYASSSNAKAVRKAFRAYVILFIFALFATGILKERSIELLPVMLVTLAMLPTPRNGASQQLKS